MFGIGVKFMMGINQRLSFLRNGMRRFAWGSFSDFFCNSTKTYPKIFFLHSWDFLWRVFNSSDYFQTQNWLRTCWFLKSNQFRPISTLDFAYAPANLRPEPEFENVLANQRCVFRWWIIKWANSVKPFLAPQKFNDTFLAPANFHSHFTPYNNYLKVPCAQFKFGFKSAAMRIKMVDSSRISHMDIKQCSGTLPLFSLWNYNDLLSILNLITVNW